MTKEFCSVQIERKPLLAILGPTASGKSALAVQTARILGGEIVNCDSMQIHRLLNVGTAKPTTQQQGQVPHHLYDIIDPAEFFSAGQYMVQARRVCQEIAGRGRVPIVVGGTGLYLRVLLEGIFPGPGRVENVRDRLHKIARQKGTDYLHRLLRRRDPEAFCRIHPSDEKRIVRAFEIYLTTGKRITDLQARKKSLRGFSILKIGLDLPRSTLCDKINCRVLEMFRSGLIEETRELLARGYRTDSKGFEALGYRHTIAFLEGDLSREMAIELTQRDTRRYAKRQMTWFRKEAEVHWIPSPGEAAAALGDVLRLVQDHWGMGPQVLRSPS